MSGRPALYLDSSVMPFGGVIGGYVEAQRICVTRDSYGNLCVNGVLVASFYNDQRTSVYTDMTFTFRRAGWQRGRAPA